jgi:hypothetical protein
MHKLPAFFGLIPVSILLTISFFVMLSLRKLEPGKLKAFGYLVATFLLVSAGIVFSVGLYSLSMGNAFPNCPMMETRCKRGTIHREQTPVSVHTIEEKQGVKKSEPVAPQGNKGFIYKLEDSKK